MDLAQVVSGLLSDDDGSLAKALAAESLRRVPVGPYGTGLYNELNRLWVTTACETPCVEWSEESKQWMVWLRLRGSNEAYPNQYEVGGSPPNSGETFEAAIRRTTMKKFGVEVGSFTELPQSAFFNKEERGWYIHRIFPVVFAGRPVENPPNIIRVPVDQLPDNTCWHHRDLIIPAAVKYWKNRQLYDAGEFLQRVAQGIETRDECGFAESEERARAAIAAALRLKNPLSPMGTDLYDAYSPHAIHVAVEGVCFRSVNPGTPQFRYEVLLRKRPGNDKYYKDLYAGLGQVVRRGDKNPPNDALDRLAQREFGGKVRFDPCDTAEVWITKDKRGLFCCKLFLALPAEMPDGEWFDVDNLPPKIVESHRDHIIPTALDSFKWRCTQALSGDLAPQYYGLVERK